MRKFIKGRIYDTNKSDCLTFSFQKLSNGETISRSLFQKRNNGEYFYRFVVFNENMKLENDLIEPIKKDMFDVYKKIVEMFI